MVKVKKKKNRKLRRQIRKTIGALTMASAIVVAAIPVPDVRADDPVAYADAPYDYAGRRLHTTKSGSETTSEIKKIYIEGATGQHDGNPSPDNWRSTVPILDKNTQIFADPTNVAGYDVVFYYAVPSNNVAVILGADVYSLPTGNNGNYLQIPEQFVTCQAYNEGGLYCAVNADNEFLYYQKEKDTYQVPALGIFVTRGDASLEVEPGQTRGTYYYTDENGQHQTTDAILYEIADYYVCDRDEFDTWKDETLYWYDPAHTRSIATTSLISNDDMADSTPTPTPTPEETPAPSETPVDDTGIYGESTAEPTWSPTEEPTQEPAVSPIAPTQEPTVSPIAPTQEPGALPSETPAAQETASPYQTPEASPSVSDTGLSDESAQTTPALDEDLMKEVFTYKVDNTIQAGRDISVKQKTASLKGGLVKNYMDTTVNVNDNKEHFFPVSDANTYLTVAVRYIGQQYLKDKLDGTSKTGEKEIDGTVTSENKLGVFAGLGINELRTGENLVGIGDYAFYNCTGLRSIMVNRGVNNGLTTIGNGAFAYCINLAACDLTEAGNLQVIGMDTFLGCVNLKKFQLPTGVRAIGDYCFMGCTGLEEMIFNDGLSAIGYDAFVDCSSLGSLTFPVGYVEKLPINYFKGCTNIQYIKIQNEQCDLIDGTSIADESTNHGNYGNPDKGCDIEEFVKALKWESFYLEGPHTSNSSIYETAQDHSLSFKYVIDGIEYYEKVEVCPEPAHHRISYVIRVENGQESLSKPILDRDCKTLIIPSNIGNHLISAIDDGCFSGYCNLENVTIPSSVKLIEANAFQGCHRLKNVIFEHGAEDALEIRSGAFNTQDMTNGHQNGCQSVSGNAVNGDGRLEYEPKLAFTGAISPTFGAFTYAMNGANNYNNSSQALSYITYYSGWPTNLAVKYNPGNPEGQRNELISYPTYEHIRVGYKNGDYPYLTPEMISDAEEAVKQEQAGSVSGYYQSIIDAGKNVNVPAGVTAVKTGLFSGKSRNGQPLAGDPDPDKYIESVTFNTVNEVEPYAFVGCESLARFYYDGSGLTGSGSIGDYAFKDCEKLTNVEIGPGVAAMGIRPFGGCKDLQNVNFVNNSNFTCENQIIFGIVDNVRNSIVECLETKGGTITADDLEGVISIQEEAFKNCDNVRSIDLSGTKVTTIPRQAFSQMDRLGIVSLPPTATNISEGAFWNTPDLYEVTITNDRMTIAADAFALVEEEETEPGSGRYDIKLVDGRPVVYPKGDPNARKDKEISFICSNDSVASNFAKDVYYIDTVEVVQVRYYVTPQGVDNARPIQVAVVSIPVNIMDDPIKWAERKVDYEPDLSNANRYPEYQYEGYVFQNWSDYESTPDGYRETYAVYKRVEEECTVNFVDVKNTTQGMVSIKVLSGSRLTQEQIPEPADKEHFIEWSADASADVSIRDRIYNDVTFYARYSDISVTPTPTTDPNASPSGGANASPGNPNATPSNNPGGSNATPTPTPKKSKSTASPTPTATPEDEVRKYTVSVSGGSGSGSYPAGAIVAVNAYYMGEGQVFDKWTSSTAGVGFANPNASSTTFTMPAANVAVTATYKTGGAGTAVTNGSSGGSGGNSGSVSQNGGTTVDVSKPGFSNTNLAGATVSGSTDNFVVKVTEDQIATDAATAALQARYGSLDRIKYLPMDISLYDSTGRNKIADTSGISVNLTLPLPDDLVQYAGNNKVAAISGGQLEDLNTRFTTVGGVPCVNFTATHFSPYVIYVDTANLTEATIDATPKTGDPIHPKWFLSLGMACVALILFFKRDRAVVVKKKVA